MMNAPRRNEETLRCNIQEQIAYEEKAFRLVEKLVLAEFVTREELENAINQIMPGHYKDIAEERSISKVCGYPLCANKISKMPKQNFHISLKHKKIYDITERKFFCSNFCFKSSKYIESQIPTDPLWMRKDKFVKVDFLDENTSNRKSVNENNKEADNRKSTENLQLTQSVYNHLEEKVRFIPETVDNDCTDSRSTCLIEPQHQKSPLSKTVDIDKLCSWLEEWCTVDTFKFFDDKKNQHEKLYVNPKEHIEDSESNQEQKASQNDRSLFMQKFLRENSEWRAEVRTEKNETEKPEASKVFISPPIDSKSQQTIRRRIVSQRLKNGFSEVFSDLSLSNADVQIDLASLIKTFRFSNQNISLRAKEWKLIAAALLQRLALDHASTALLLEKRKVENVELLNSCNVDEEQFAKLSKMLERNLNRLEKHNNHSLTDEVSDYDNDSLD